MKFIVTLGILAALILLVALGCEECSEEPSASAPAPATKSEPAATETAPRSPSADEVVARSGDMVVTQGEVDEVLERNRKNSAMFSGGRLPQLTPEQQKEKDKRDTLSAIRNLMLSKEVLAEARAKGLEITDEEINEKLETYYKMYGSKEKFLKASGMENLSDEEIHRQMVDGLLREKYIEQEVYSKIPEPTDKDMREWYDQHKDKFATPEMVSARIISVKVAPGASEEDVKAAKEKLADAAKRIKKGEAFEAVAKEVSEDAWATKGGEMGLIRARQARLGEDFDKAAFSAEIGKLSDPVKTNDGYCLVEVTEKKAAEQKSFEESKDQIKNWLPGLKKFEAMGKFMSQKKSELKIDIVGEEQEAPAQQ
ncbi:MAG: peptidyl-prolyl cis-trans isomerase [Candidatus Coatesbacteria bacterium]|nr:peptidyl-prolyl cis-trans isomerase [Candidatus Coatesbacteria bacterium]